MIWQDVQRRDVCKSVLWTVGCVRVVIHPQFFGSVNQFWCVSGRALPALPRVVFITQFLGGAMGHDV